MGKWQERIDTFCLRGWLYMERSDTPISAREDLLERSVSTNSRRQPSTDTRQQLHHEYPNAMIMHVCIMHDECMMNADKQTCSTRRSGNQPSGEKTKATREQRKSTGDWDIREHLSCRGGRPPEASGGIVGHNRRTEFNIQAYAPQQLVMKIRDTEKQPDF